MASSVPLRMSVLSTKAARASSVYVPAGDCAPLGRSVCRDLPGECPQGISGDYKAVRGGHVDTQAIEDWVGIFAAPQGDD